MATVRVNQVEPPPPPKTYDILGLTEDEMELVVNLVGLAGGNMAYKLYQCLPYGHMFKTSYFSNAHLINLTPTNGK